MMRFPPIFWWMVAWCLGFAIIYGAATIAIDVARVAWGHG